MRHRDLGRRPPGAAKPTAAKVLEKGADWLQSNAPVGQFSIYMVGFHCGRDQPELQMEAHHYCHQVNAEFFQCLIFDGNGRDANLIGVEYIVSERLFQALPAEEQASWHPHNYEVFSGELVAPGLPEAAEEAALRFLVNSYGKTWHFWHSGRYDRSGDGEPLPLGPPRLMWSFNREGQVDPAIKHSRDEAMAIDTARRRAHRRRLLPLAHPQAGVARLDGAFKGTGPRPDGVRDVDEG